MSLSRRYFSLGIVMKSLLLGCGFTPLLDKSKNGPNILNQGRFDFFSPSDEISFNIREELLKDLGFPKKPKHKISINTNLTSIKGIITKENDITRYNLILRTTLKLISLKDNGKFYEKNFISETAYSASKNVTGFATKMAETSAKQRLAKDTANKIVIDLLLLGEEI